jgi:chromosome segregation ATPase
MIAEKLMQMKEAMSEITQKINILEMHKKEIIKLTRNLQAEKQRIEGLWQELENQQIENGKAKRQLEEKNDELERILRNQVPRVGRRRVHEKKYFKPIQLMTLMILTTIISTACWKLFIYLC